MNETADTNNLVVQLCIQGTQAEFIGDLDAARQLYRQAWEAASTDYEACIAAHYVGHLAEDPQEAFHWHQVALTRAEAVTDGSVDSFYPSLYINMGHSYELLGNSKEAGRYYKLAASLGLEHQTD